MSGHSQAIPALMLGLAVVSLDAALRPYAWRKYCSVASGSDSSEEAVLDVPSDDKDSSEEVQLLIPSALWFTPRMRCCCCC